MEKKIIKKNIIAIAKLFILFMFITSFVFAQDSKSGLRNNNKRYEMSFVDADFQSVFHSISVLAGKDILIAPDIQGKMSIMVTEKTWQEMMDIVCNMHDFKWINEGNYINVQRNTSYQEKKKREAENREKSDDLAVLVRRSFQIMHASASEMANVLSPLKSTKGRISVVPRNNAIIVYDTEKRLEQMEKTINELDIETLQIVITAKLVVVDSRLVNDLGVDWSNVNVGDANSRVQANFSNQPGQAGLNLGGTATATGVAPATALSVNAFDQNMQVTISNILSDSRSEILASPQISTLDHTEANIFMGDQISIRVIDVNGQSSTQLIESGIKLTVTPHVAGDNRILLELHPENNSYSYDDKGQVVISKQEAKTQVVVSDGETVVIGGLTKNDEIEVETGIPFLKDIPILGYLFKNTKKEINKKDLIIFVTPRIMRNYLADSAMQPSVNNSVKATRVKAATPAKPKEAPVATKKVVTTEEIAEEDTEYEEIEDEEEYEEEENTSEDDGWE